METVYRQYITDEQGKKLAAVLPIQDYQRMLDALEELEAIHLYDEAKATQEPSLPMEEAFRIIETKRRQ